MKRIFDVTLIIIFSPIIILIITIVSLLIKIIDGSPIIFTQKRAGLNGKPFIIFKFRTMKGQPKVGITNLNDSDRLTSFGRFLRSTSLDELPEIWNVLRGDMSLVGPRPLLMEYLSRYSTDQAKRHEVKPGITGWAQVNGRNSIGWEERFELDLWYVKNYSLWVDVKILFLTLIKVLKRDDINADGEATMFEFFGKNTKCIRSDSEKHSKVTRDKNHPDF